MLEEIYSEIKNKMELTVESFFKELRTVRTGRATISLLDGITLPYYNIDTPLNQLANLMAPESNLLIVQPYDPSIIGDIEKAILKSDRGFNPMNDGKIIRIPVPPLTEERRQEMARLVGKVAEESKTAIRQIRRLGNDKVKKLEKDKDISQDDEHRAYDNIQEITDSYIEKIEEAMKKKREEILKV
jgi:ribosome recycling factor